MSNSITSEVISAKPSFPIRAGQELGDALRRWRRTLRISQMDLALEATISPRHLSFIETGRSQPSREVVLQLAGALNLPLRHSNALLLAAGYSPEFGAAALDDTRLAAVQHALRRHLGQHEPYPAVVVNPAYDILMVNNGFRRLAEMLTHPGVLERYGNVYRLLFAADGLRPAIACWPNMRAGLLARLRGESLLTRDEATAGLLAELEAMPNTAPDEMPVDPWGGLPVMTLEFHRNNLVWRFFSTITSFGTPLDITVQELRIESLFPADEVTQAFFDSHDGRQTT